MYVAACTFGAAEGSGIHEAEHFGEHLDAAAQGLLQKLLFGDDHPILQHRCRQSLSHGFFRAGLVQEAENAAFIDRVDGRVHVRIAGQHDANRIG